MADRARPITQDDGISVDLLSNNNAAHNRAVVKTSSNGNLSIIEPCTMLPNFWRIGLRCLSWPMTCVIQITNIRSFGSILFENGHRFRH